MIRSTHPFHAPERLAVLTAAEMAAWDARATGPGAIPAPVLMEAAGRGAAAVVARLHPEGTVLCLCGAGNNGGDGVVVARTLRAWGRDARVAFVGGREPDDALRHGWELSRIEPPDLPASLAAAAVVVDALLGTGAEGAPRAAHADAIRAVTASGRPVVALDVPSGVDPTTGAVPGEAIHAAVTVTFGAPKTGLLRFPGRAMAGRIIALEIGLPPLGEAEAWLITPRWAASVLPAVPSDAHKGAMGTVAIVAGRAGFAGAGVLAAWGALRSGAGMVRLAAAADNRVVIHAALPEALYVDREAGPDAIASGAAAVVAGPGMGTDAASGALLAALLRSAGAPVVLDADALTLLAAHPGMLDGVDRPLLLTPHAGEMGRLLGTDTAAVIRDPFAAARAAAERYGCAVLLKGTPSVVAAPGEPLLVGVAGHSGLATGGNGDVLAGVAGALLARDLSPRDAAGAALWYAGRAAELAGRGRGLLPRDVAAALPDALDEPPDSVHALGMPEVLLDLPPAR
jgi:ADP-dependent NAD(P)H-hydrate dehydratase / NAD(P)H-hydrate epimerase